MCEVVSVKFRAQDQPHPAPALPPPEWQRIGLSVLLAMLVHALIATALCGDYPLDIDVANLLAGSVHFAPLHHSPHPPGYLVYVLLLRCVTFFLGPTIQAAQVLAITCTVEGAPVLAWFVLRLRPDEPRLAVIAPWLWLLAPVALFHSADAQMHGAEATTILLLLIAVLRAAEHPTNLRAVAVGACLALGIALRPSLVVIGGPLVLAVLFRQWRVLLVVALTVLVGTLAWLVPTAWACGGLAPLLNAQRLLTLSFSAASRSIFSSRASADLVRGNMLELAVTLVSLWLPVLAFAVLTRPRQELSQPLSRAVLAGSVPAVLFYLALFCDEPGYLAGLLPLTIAWGLLGARPRSNVVLAALVAVALQIGLFCAPDLPGLVPKMPSARYLWRADVKAGVIVDSLHLPPPGAARVLVVSDLQTEVSLRMLTAVRHDVAALMRVPATKRNDHAWGLATFDDWLPLPGPVLLQTGPAATIHTDREFDVLIVDAQATPPTRRQILAQLRCPLPPEVQAAGNLQLPIAVCLPQRQLTVGKHTLDFNPRH